ncbi:MAG TPA: FAD synthetase family protein [Rhabdochlamydiaceae bacterium]
MKIVRSIEKLPYALTIGNFDGLHRGHQQLISALKKTGLRTAVLTFSNHPSEVLKSANPAPLLSTPEHKLRLLDQSGVDLAIVLPFTKELAAETYDHFLKNLKEHLCFTHLILGNGSALGNRQLGTQDKVETLGKTLGFKAEYIDKFLEVSSGATRKALQQGDLTAVHLLLGRPFSIYTQAAAEISLKGLCLPPDGTYAVQVEGVAGTARIEGSTLYLQTSEALSHQPIEIIFKD